jgi:transcriptional regulator with XRE-family HTH domain
METGKLIKELRIQKGMTQEELAEKTEVSTRTIQRIENGEVDPRAYTLQMIAKALEVDFSMFIVNEPDEREEIQQVNDCNWLGILYLSGIIPLVFPTMLMWNLKRNKTKGMASHYRAVISSQLTMVGVILGCLWVYWKVNMLTPLIGILLVNAFISIMNAIKVMSGDTDLKMPFMKKEKLKL